jgi:hypothetical protein
MKLPFLEKLAEARIITKSKNINPEDNAGAGTEAYEAFRRKIAPNVGVTDQDLLGQGYTALAPTEQEYYAGKPGLIDYLNSEQFGADVASGKVTPEQLDFYNKLWAGDRYSDPTASGGDFQNLQALLKRSGIDLSQSQSGRRFIRPGIQTDLDPFDAEMGFQDVDIAGDKKELMQRATGKVSAKTDDDKVKQPDFSSWRNIPAPSYIYKRGGQKISPEEVQKMAQGTSVDALLDAGVISRFMPNPGSVRPQDALARPKLSYSSGEVIPDEVYSSLSPQEIKELKEIGYLVDSGEPEFITPKGKKTYQQHSKAMQALQGNKKPNDIERDQVISADKERDFETQRQIDQELYADLLSKSMAQGDVKDLDAGKRTGTVFQDAEFPSLNFKPNIFTGSLPISKSTKGIAQAVGNKPVKVQESAEEGGTISSSHVDRAMDGTHVNDSPHTRFGTPAGRASGITSGRGKTSIAEGSRGEQRSSRLRDWLKKKAYSSRSPEEETEYVTQHDDRLETDADRFRQKRGLMFHNNLENQLHHDTKHLEIPQRKGWHRPDYDSKTEVVTDPETGEPLFGPNTTSTTKPAFLTTPRFGLGDRLRAKLAPPSRPIPTNPTFAPVAPYLGESK